MEKELIVKWQIKPSETARILELLPELARLSKTETGNLAYSIFQSEENPNVIFLHEIYVNEAAIEAHKASAAYQEIVVGRIMPHLEFREVNFVNKLI